ncbi:P-loop NTPase fold protein [Oceanobacillus kimchii]|uniref:P-loop NTPase fold protein n=1 Tax=Oceanobacillus kimchii TaxID=746691 RepID=UPI000986724E|nr:P-loop NTPase fold protein [Oceanobacillus kimchii]
MNADELKIIVDKINELPYRKILIDGQWGIGKTKYVKDSIDSNEHLNQTSSISYSSLFGVKELNFLIEEMYTHILESLPQKSVENIFQNLEI